jgi:S-adenosylmethionine:tRNA ribosyltransferase-isomerase
VQISDFDYELPEALIAQHPLAERDASRMLVVDRASGTWQDSQFASFPDQLRANDVLVLNNTKVFSARLIGKRIPAGGSIEVLLLREVQPARWQVLARPARRLRVGSQVTFGSTLDAEVIAANDDGTRVIQFDQGQNLQELIDEIGQPPLPPYIKRDQSGDKNDRERYQTVYARERGAIAAPTAGLHFTDRILREIAERGVRIAELTLHVGYGTFEPVRVQDVDEHRVAQETFFISDETAATINEARKLGGRVFAVGTTTTRALESATDASRQVNAGAGVAELTVVPGYQFRAVDTLLTNFHLPRSSLLLLVSAFAGRELILAAYRYAVANRYRFYSYGDCMLIK